MVAETDYGHHAEPGSHSDFKCVLRTRPLTPRHPRRGGKDPIPIVDEAGVPYRERLDSAHASVRLIVGSTLTVPGVAGGYRGCQPGIRECMDDALDVGDLRAEMAVECTVLSFERVPAAPGARLVTVSNLGGLIGSRSATPTLAVDAFRGLLPRCGFTGARVAGIRAAHA
jgi:hypothetical protein